MRRAERLIRIVQALREAAPGAVTAHEMGHKFEVSERTIYRDIAHLIGSGAPIDGEAGVGYVLRPGFDLPPLTFSFEQLDALALGARLVKATGDKDLASAANEALAKIEHALPESHRERLRNVPLFAAFLDETVRPDAFGPVRNAIANKRKLRVRYQSLADDTTQRVIRPLALTCFGRVWLLSAWCELRNDFRHFRTDRVERLTVLAESFDDEPGKRYEDMRRAA
ncbi:YafY family protein [Maricaulis sp.]|uniref:helix-turn-helix transcriptional regulator n=1 Tax=Maricaulis sp. TaxID=1486257 RepID=UPI00262A23A8|nr:YafY family protein [Maricaulis sp.]MDF1767650.1 YafY family protein [Maricaulis sp.]